MLLTFNVLRLSSILLAYESLASAHDWNPNALKSSYSNSYSSENVTAFFEKVPPWHAQPYAGAIRDVDYKSLNKTRKLVASVAFIVYLTQSSLSASISNTSAWINKASRMVPSAA